MARTIRRSAKVAARKATPSAPSPAKKHHWKRPGFNAFGAQSSTARKRSVVKLARCTEVEPPETGIHSLAWANSITPQDCGILKLPVEVRHRIWNLVFENLSCGDQPIAPTKKGNIFHSRNWPDAAQETIALSETCRQIYVDVVGGGLLYKAKEFSFTPGLLLNYLWVINPVHKNSIRSIHLDIRVRYRSFSVPSKAFAMLADCQGLQNLHLEFNVDPSLCIRSDGYHFAPFSLAGANPVIHNGRYIALDLITKLRLCTALREIKGLQSLRMEFITWARERTGARDGNGFPIYQFKEVNLSAGTTGPYYELEEELRKELVARK